MKQFSFKINYLLLLTKLQCSVQFLKVKLWYGFLNTAKNLRTIDTKSKILSKCKKFPFLAKCYDFKPIFSLVQELPSIFSKCEKTIRSNACQLLGVYTLRIISILGDILCIHFLYIIELLIDVYVVMCMTMSRV